MFRNYVHVFALAFFTLKILNLVACNEEVTDVRAELLENYHNNDPPGGHSSKQPVKINIGMIVTHFELSEVDGLFGANVWFTVTWNDERLVWNMTEADSPKALRFSVGEIWKPDITLINNAEPTDTDHFGDSLLIVKPDGSVIWTPPAKLVTYCSMNLIRWPYDEHNCVLKIGSWTHSGKEIDINISPSILQNPNQAIDSQLYVPNSQWSLVSTKAEKDDEFYACCQNPYAVVKYMFQIQRSAPIYVATTVLPIVVITFVNIMIFLLPPNAGEKITLASINFLVVCLFLIYFEARLPAIGDHLPLLVLLYSINSVLIGISLIMSVIVINLSRNRKPASPPQCLRLFCNASFAQILGLGYIVPYISQTHSRLSEGVEMRTRENGRASFDFTVDKDDHTAQLVVDEDAPVMANAEWILLAAMIDRLTLIVYSVVSAVVLGLCLA